MDISSVLCFQFVVEYVVDASYEKNLTRHKCVNNINLELELVTGIQMKSRARRPTHKHIHVHIHTNQTWISNLKHWTNTKFECSFTYISYTRLLFSSSSSLRENYKYFDRQTQRNKKKNSIFKVKTADTAALFSCGRWINTREDSIQIIVIAIDFFSLFFCCCSM